MGGGLQVTIYVWFWVGWGSGEYKAAVSPLQHDTKSSKEVSRDLSFVLTTRPSQSLPQLLNNNGCSIVDPTQYFPRHRLEGNTFGLACLAILVPFLTIAMPQSVSRLNGCPVYQLHLQTTDDTYVQGLVEASSVMR